MSKQILIVEDEPNMLMGLKDNLEFEGFFVDSATDGEAGLSKINEKKFDLILLDVMLPKLSGFDVCKLMRKNGNNTPVILLTAKGEELDKVLGLEFGADDYVTKPFSLRELLARIKAVMRRGPGLNTSDSVCNDILIGKLLVNFVDYSASTAGQSVKMTHKEFEILNFLWKHKNTTVSRYDLLEEVWEYKEQPTTRTVDNFVLKLRNRIEENPNDPKVILTVHGTGYKLLV